MFIKDLVSKYDPERQFDVLINSYEQIEYVKNNQYSLSSIDASKIKNIIVTGLGGSAIGGDVISNLFKEELNIPYFVNRNYNLPQFVNENTLVVLSSYSGNTEETISAAKDALERNAQIIAVTTGGKILEFANKNNIPCVVLKKGYQPRYSLYLNMFSVAKAFEVIGLISLTTEQLDSYSNLLKRKGEEYSSEDNLAFKIAESLVGFIPVIYSCDSFTNAVGLRLKGQFNENSKVHAFHNVFPELNHNEIIGWETQNENQLRTKAIMIKDDSYHPQVKKRYEITSQLIEKSSAEIIALKSSLNDYKLRLIDLIYLGDWISYYLAILRGKDPSEIDYIHHLKKELAK